MRVRGLLVLALILSVGFQGTLTTAATMVQPTAGPTVDLGTATRTFSSHTETAAVQEARGGPNAAGEGVTVAIVGAGIDEEHPGFADRVVGEWTVTPEGVPRGDVSDDAHATHLAGILVGSGAGAGPTRGDVSGIAPGARLVSLDISDPFTTSNAVRAFEWIHEHHAEHGIEVVVSSWGRQRDQVSYEPEDPVVRASDALVDDGIVVVFSAGNGGPQPGRMTVEAANPRVITVGASTTAGTVAPFSSRGPVLVEGDEAAWTKPDLIAPGEHVISARAGGSGPGTNYVVMNGTSMAAPHVAGAAAVLLSLEPDLTPQQVADLLASSATDVGAAGLDEASGAGLLDLQAATEQVQGPGTHDEAERTGPASLLEDPGPTVATRVGSIANPAGGLLRGIELDAALHPPGPTDRAIERGGDPPQPPASAPATGLSTAPAGIRDAPVDDPAGWTGRVRAASSLRTSSSGWGSGPGRWSPDAAEPCPERPDWTPAIQPWPRQAAGAASGPVHPVRRAQGTFSPPHQGSTLGRHDGSLGTKADALPGPRRCSHRAPLRPRWPLDMPCAQSIG